MNNYRFAEVIPNTTLEDLMESPPWITLKQICARISAIIDINIYTLLVSHKSNQDACQFGNHRDLNPFQVIAAILSGDCCLDFISTG